MRKTQTGALTANASAPTIVVLCILERLYRSDDMPAAGKSWQTETRRAQELIHKARGTGGVTFHVNGHPNKGQVDTIPNINDRDFWQFGIGVFSR